MSWTRRLLNLVRSDRHSNDIAREMDFHLAERIDELVSGGMPRADATAQARRMFGNYGAQREHTRDADILTWIDTLVADVRYGLRSLRHSPAFTLVAVLSLALGIGANTAIFTLVNAVMLRGLPVSHPEALAQLKIMARSPVLSNPVFDEMRARQTVFNGVFAWSHEAFNLASSGEVRNVTGNFVTGEYFSTLGVRPALGRVIAAPDDRRGCEAIAVLSYPFWQSEYGGTADVVGRTIALTGHQFTIVGVAQPGFQGVDVGEATQVFAPLCAVAAFDGGNRRLAGRSTWWLFAIGRLKPGMTLDAATRSLVAISPAVFAATVPGEQSAQRQKNYLARTFDLAPASRGMSLMRNVYQRALLTLMVIVALVLLIACANVANLLLARSAVRQREMAVRLALGAGRGRIVRQLLTESLLISVSGAVLGLAFAQWGSRLLVRFLPGFGSPVYLDLGIDVPVLGFSMAVAVITGLAFGLAPAWRASQIRPHAALKANARNVVSGGRFSVGKTLVVAQIAISLTLVIGAGLLLGTFRKLATSDIGFRPDDVLLVSYSLAPGTDSAAKRLAAHENVLRELRLIPGVRSASLSSLTPLSHEIWNEELVVDGFVSKSPSDGVAFFNAVSEGYFRTLGTALIAGRDIGLRDVTGARQVAVINEMLAKRFFGGANPLGRTFRQQRGREIGDPVEVVGVVHDAKYGSMREKTLPTAFLSFRQDSELGTSMKVELDVAGGTASVVPAVKKALAGIDPRVSMSFTAFARQVDDAMASERLLATLSGFFGGLALLLATLGLYGVMSYSVARRRNEIGIRMALGAGQRRVARMILREVGAVLVAGLVLGIALAVATTRLIASFLYGLTPTDAATLGGSMAVLAAVGLLAAYLPARRASRVDPMDALRED